MNRKKPAIIAAFIVGLLINANAAAWSLYLSNFDEEAGYWVGTLINDAPASAEAAEDAASFYLSPPQNYGEIQILDDNGGKVIRRYFREDFFASLHQLPHPWQSTIPFDAEAIPGI